MFLATTALSEFWDPQERLLFLGPWCTLHNQREKWAHLDYAMLPNPWDDRECFRQAGQYCQQVFEKVLAELGQFLNRVHGVTFTQRYWRILLGPWLLNFIDIFYDRFVCLEAAFSSCSSLHTWLLDENCYRTPWNFLEASDFTEVDHNNLQIYSQIIRLQGYTFPSKPAHEKPETGPREVKRSMISWLPRKIIDQLEVVIAKFRSDDEVVFLEGNVDRFSKLRLLATGGFHGKFISKVLPGRSDCRAEAETRPRRDLAELSSGNDPFVRLLVASLPVNFPAMYLEGFRPCREWVLDQFHGERLPKILCSIGRIWADDFGKFLGGEISQRGGKLISLQHGAGYGWTRFLSVEDHERRISDRFYAWGWAGQESDSRLKNLAAAKLCIRERKRGLSAKYPKILLISTGYPRYLYRFQDYPVGSQWEDYIAAIRKFLQALAPTILNEVIYRGHSFDYGWQMTDRIKPGFSQVTIDDHSRRYPQQMMRSRLLVFDHPGTTFLEALAANAPSILFFDTRIWEVREAARPYLEVLREAGIFHEDPQAAAQQINRVYQGVDDWWFDTDRQQARNKVAAHFAYSGHNWNREWVAAIEAELLEVRDYQGFIKRGEPFDAGEGNPVELKTGRENRGRFSSENHITKKEPGAHTEKPRNI